jgi:hypothetical protein
MPVPSGLVEKNGSNARSAVPSGSPGPSSSTVRTQLIVFVERRGDAHPARGGVDGVVDQVEHRFPQRGRRAQTRVDIHL